MIAAMRPDIDNIDEYVRNTTARAFSVVASALGIPALLPFLKAVCQSKKSWQALYTGIKIAILIGCAILPHLRSLVEIIEHDLNDENQKVRTITALSLAALAEASAPYGIESFDSVSKPLWKGIRSHRGKVLAAFLKAIGFIIPLMDAIYGSYYTKEVMFILIREFQSPDEEIKKIVLKVVKQCVSMEGVEAEDIRTNILLEFFRNFWLMIDGILYAFQEQTSDDANVMLNGFGAVVNAEWTAASAVKHMALGIAGLDCEDAFVHLLNYVWQNIVGTSPHVINAVMEAIEGMRVALGEAAVLNYYLQGLFHPARKVREVY
ncbi:hypothetical protein HHK36_011648 [Tetracentron sinense]|uniref:Splicing factor 3B subunit 1 n=1 Tax=Tetracentron sinense TaxID=13715 RepID=A0A834Z9U6_TETSI|nr:hypothetical protein HHK36_011648 [Tetracentron sinense]